MMETAQTFSSGQPEVQHAPGEKDAPQPQEQTVNLQPTVNAQPVEAKPQETFSWPDNWKEQLPDDIKGEKSLAQIQDIPSLAKSYVHAQKMVGQNKAVVPDPNLATPDDWRAFFQKAGLPESVDEYNLDIKEADQMPEGFLEEFKAKAHEFNILPHQAKEMLEWYRNYESQYLEKQTEESQAELDKMHDGFRKLVGAAYDRKIAYANKLINELGSPELSQLLVESGLNKHPEILKMFSTVGEKMYGEDEVLGEEKGKMSALTPEEARDKWNDIKGDKSHPYWKAAHPNHQKALEEVQKLFQYM